jgi:hypothetical protein
MVSIEWVLLLVISRSHDSMSRSDLPSKIYYKHSKVKTSVHEQEMLATPTFLDVKTPSTMSTYTPSEASASSYTRNTTSSSSFTADSVSEDELDVMTASSPPVSSMQLRTRPSVGNIVAMPRKRVRTVSAGHTKENNQMQEAKRLKMEDKKAVSVL